MKLKDIWYALCSSCRPHRSRTVRLAFPLVLVAAIFAGAAVITSEQQSYIAIETSPSTVSKGDTFFINVTVVVHTPVNAVNVVIEYPESQMSVTNIDTGESVLTLWTEEPYAKDGKIYLSGGTFKKGFLGEHTIARVRAKAIESGVAQVLTNSVRLIAGDGLGTEVQAAANGDQETRVYIVGEDGTIEGNVTVKIITDLDGDGDVDLKDISAFMAAWFDKNTIFDFNGDGRMTFRDFSIILAESFFN